MESKQTQVICGFPWILPDTSPPFFKYRHQAACPALKGQSHESHPCSYLLSRIAGLLSVSQLHHELTFTWLHVRIPRTLTLCSPDGLQRSSDRTWILCSQLHTLNCHKWVWGWFFPTLCYLIRYQPRADYILTTKECEEISLDTALLQDPVAHNSHGLCCSHELVLRCLLNQG